MSFNLKSKPQNKTVVKRKRNNTPLRKDTKLKDYRLLECIDGGGYSLVYKAISLITDEVVAIKEYMPNSLKVRTDNSHKISFLSEDDRKRFNRGLDYFNKEMGIISTIKHNNVIDILDYFEMNGTSYIVMPYEQGMSLAAYLGSIYKHGTYMQEEHIIKIFVGILEAIKELHDNHLLHLDLKPQNIWLRPNKEILILDFGAALESNQVSDKMIKTDGYAAVEQYMRNYDPTNIGYWTDYYGIGTTMYYLLVGKKPKSSLELEKENVFIDVFENCNNLYHYKILEKVNQLCQISPDKRKQINIDSIIQELKNIIPFQYQPTPIEEIIAIKPQYVKTLNLNF